MEFELTATPEYYSFRFYEHGEYTMIGQGEAAYVTTEVGGRFTGNYIGLYATGNGMRCKNPARFHWFEYKQED